MLHEGRTGVVDLASQLGHSSTMTLNTYGQVIAELRDAPRTSATEAIMRFRGGAPRMPPKRRNATLLEPEDRAEPTKPTAGLEPATPSLRVKCSTS